LSVGDRVSFLGWQSPAALRRIMRDDADVLLFPSLHEDCSHAVAEAVSSGLPVICLDRGGPPVLAGPVGTHCRAEGTTREVVTRLSRALAGFEPPSREAIDEALIGMSIDARVAAIRDIVESVDAKARGRAS
jgi:glycosyltransferase involved in cell wall biosynthesis